VFPIRISIYGWKKRLKVKIVTIGICDYTVRIRSTIQRSLSFTLFPLSDERYSGLILRIRCQRYWLSWSFSYLIIRSCRTYSLKRLWLICSFRKLIGLFYLLQIVTFSLMHKIVLLNKGCWSLAGRLITYQQSRLWKSKGLIDLI